MAYFPAYIDSTGLHLPTYNDINQYLLDQYTAIYGQSVTDNISTTDVQSISVFALMINDAYQVAQGIFNGMSPSKAIGTQQDSLYKLNGIARNPATFSTCTVTVTGTPNFEMINRVAMDQNNNLWDLPTDFIIPPSGTVNVTATCETPGAVTAAIGAINIMNNPVADWFSVTNSVAASPGVPVETDSAFRARQALSVMLPSQSLFDGTLAAVAAVNGVTDYGGIENPTGVADSYGNPPHSISIVVQGGSDTDIANAIYLNKTPGCFTNGTTTVNVADPITGQTMPISFFKINEPAGSGLVSIDATLMVKELTGFTLLTWELISNAVTDYLNHLQIGEFVSLSAIIASAMNVNVNLLAPTFSVLSAQIAIHGSALGNADIPISFNQVSQAGTVTINTTT